MRRILSVLPLLATSMAFAQQAPAFKLPHTYTLGQPVLNTPNHLLGCPVGMTAEQQATGATQWVVSLEDSRSNPSSIPPGKMGVRVSLKAPANFSAAKVEVVYMVPPKGVMLVGGNTAMETRTFDLHTGDEPVQDMERSLLIGSGVSIQRVKLLGVTYADGTVWNPNATYNCSVPVSHLLRVASR